MSGHRLTRVLLGSLLALFTSSLFAYTPNFQSEPCPIGVDDAASLVECGSVQVPENWQQPDGTLLKLFVAKVKSASTAPHPDPVVFITGGPGFGAVRLAQAATRHPMWKALRAERDLILLDFRGVGYSEPAFCAQENRDITAAYNQQTDQREHLLKVQDALQRCAQSLRNAGYDPSQYHTPHIAQDIDAIRKAMGYERWNLYGLSYGVRIVQTVMRDLPAGVRIALLVSPTTLNAVPFYVGATFAPAIEKVSEACKANTKCLQQFPDLEAEFYRLIDEYERNPLQLPVRDQQRYPGGYVVLDGTLLASSIYQAMFTRQFIEMLPLTLDALQRRDVTTLTTMAEQVGVGPDVFSWPLNYAVVCFDGGPYMDTTEGAEDKARFNELAAWFQRPDWKAACAAFHSARADESERRALSSDIPTLIMAGEYDPATPPAYAQLAAEQLSRATVITVPAHSHHFPLSAKAECTVSLMTVFFDAPTQPIDQQCLSKIAPLAFPLDVHANGALARLLAELPRSLLFSVVVGVSILTLLLTVFAWPVVALFQRRPEDTNRHARFAYQATWLGTCCWLIWLAGIYFAINQALAINPYLLAFGVPAGWHWLFWLPWLTLLLTTISAVFAFQAWRHRWWGGFRRWRFTGVVLANLVLLVVVMRWQLLP